jgi:hypothetical protein
VAQVRIISKERTDLADKAGSVLRSGERVSVRLYLTGQGDYLAVRDTPRGHRYAGPFASMQEAQQKLVERVAVFNRPCEVRPI